jgi:hypothetical protein
MVTPTPFENTLQLFKLVAKDDASYVSSFNLLPNNASTCFLDDNTVSLKMYIYTVQLISLKLPSALIVQGVIDKISSRSVNQRPVLLNIVKVKRNSARKDPRRVGVAIESPIPHLFTALNVPRPPNKHSQAPSIWHTNER